MWIAPAVMLLVLQNHRELKVLGSEEGVFSIGGEEINRLYKKGFIITLLTPKKMRMEKISALI